MDFSLNTNLDALVANYYLNQTNSGISQALLQLSTGLKINSPADNPTGFIAATGYQTQVDGMNQAISNIQSSVNMVKTAASAVTQITTLVQSIHTSALDAQSNPANAAVDQASIQSALQSLNNIAGNTSYGSTNLLNGTAGTTASVLNSSDVSAATIGGTFGGGTTQTGNATITVTTAAVAATVTGSVSYAGTSSTFSASGTVTINGQNITVTAGETVQTFLSAANTISNQTGISASLNSGKIVLTQQNQGANFAISESDSAGAILAAGNSTSVSGVNAVASVSASTLINGAISTQSVTFTGGKNSGDSGLLLSDSNGNQILLTNAGNSTSTTNVSALNISSNPSQFQIGANAGQTASFSFQNMGASALGTNVYFGQSLNSINVTTPSGAANAVSIANAALTQTTNYAAQLGSFQTNVLTATQNYLSNSVSNITASISNIMDVNVAQESTTLANLQLQQQSGIQALYTANNMGALYLKLLP